MNPQDALLGQLRDIHGAPEVAWWPPAPGWWILAILLLIGIVLLIRHLLRARRVRQRRQRLLHFVEWIETSVDPQQAPGQFLSDLNRVFKLVALRAFPDSHCAHLAGREWVAFLQARFGQEGARDSLAALADGPYRPASSFDAEALLGLARQWVQQHG